MASPYVNLVEEIFQQSVIEALNEYGINVSDRASDSYSNFDQKRVFLREAVLNKLVVQWTYDPAFRASIGYHLDPATGKYVADDLDTVKELVLKYVRQEIRYETDRMQVDAERKILENIAGGKYFKKGGLKKLVENVTDVVSPGSKNFNKLMGTKVSDHTGFRNAILDVALSATSDGLVKEIGKMDQFRGADQRPKISPATGDPTALKSGQTAAQALVDILQPKTKEIKQSSPYISTADSIKKAFDKSSETERIKKEIEEIRKNSAGRVLRGATPAQINQEINDKYKELEDHFERGSITINIGGVTVTGSANDLLSNELTRLNTELLGSGTSTGLTYSPREYLFFGAGKAVYSDVWNVDPQATLKISQFTATRDKFTPGSLLYNHYNGLVTKYTAQLYGASSVSASKEAFTFSFKNGELVVTDRLRSTYESAVSDLAKGLKFVDVSPTINQFRTKTINIDTTQLQSVIIHLKNKGVLTVEEVDFVNKSEDLIKRFKVHQQALEVLEGMRKVIPTDPSAVIYNATKADFIANIALFESDLAKQKEIIDAINSNNYINLRTLIGCGSGKKPTDLKLAALYDEFYKSGEVAQKLSQIDPANVDEFLKEFNRWAKKRSIDNEIVSQFITRRYVENTIYAVQLVTDPKYLKAEIKRKFHQEVKARIEKTFFNHFPANTLLGKYIGLGYDFLNEEDKKKFIKEKAWKEILKLGRDAYDKTEWAKTLKELRIFGKSVPIDLLEALENPWSYFKGRGLTLLTSTISDFLNKNYRRLVEGFTDTVARFKKMFWKAKDFVRNYAITFLQNTGTRLGAQLAATLAGLTVPVAGWIVTAVLLVLPVLLKPIFGDVDLGQMLKKFFKFLLLGPCLVVFIIWYVILVPIISLFSNFTQTLFSFLQVDKVNSQNLEDSYLKKDYTFGANSSYANGADLVFNLVTTSGNKCITNDKQPIYSSPVISGWNNLKAADFDNLPGNRNLNCRIMCNVQRSMATLYPGHMGKDVRLLNCNASNRGQGVFDISIKGPVDTARYWCTYTVTDAYRTDFPNDISDTAYAGVTGLDGWLKTKVLGGVMDRIDAQGCFEKDKLMAGAAIIMSTSGCSLAEGNHAAIFLKFEGNNFVYVNSNSGVLKESTTFQDCGGGRIKLNPKVYSPSLIFQICGIYQLNSSFSPPDTSCPTDCIPDINNY